MIDERKIQLSKSFYQRTLELTQSLQIIRDSIDLFKKGKSYQILPMCGQLRSLLTEKSNKNPELLFEVSEILKFPLNLYYLPDTPLPDYLPKPHFHFISPEISISQKHKKQIKISLKDFLSVEIISLNDIQYTARELIDSMANFAGGSHYASKIPQNYARLFSLGLYRNNELEKLGIMNFQILNDLIAKIGSVIFELGLELVKKIAEFEFFTCMYIPKQILDNEAFLIDMNYEKSLMRTAAFFDKNFIFNFFVQDANGDRLLVTDKNPLAGNKYYLINVSFGLTDSLETQLKVFINGEKVIDETFSTVLAFRNDFGYFKKYHNRSVVNYDRGLTFGLLEHVLYSRVLSSSEKQELSNYFDNKSTKNHALGWFSKGNYGYVEAGNSTMQVYGDVKHQTVDEFRSASPD